MITSELKAKELIEKFHQAMYAPIGGEAYTYTNRAKQCAIICVQNLIAEHTFKHPISWNKERKSYWESVLKHLEAL